MAAPPREKILAVSIVDLLPTERLLSHLRSRYENAEITLVVSIQFPEQLAGSGLVDHIHNVYHERMNLVAAAIRLLLRLRGERFDLFALLCQDSSKIRHAYNVVLFSFLIHCRERIAIDQNYASTELGMAKGFASLLDNVTSLVGSPVAKMLTLMILPATSRSAVLAERPHLKSRRGGSPRIAVLVPILPDISHTFIYREVLAMRSQGAQFDVVVLEEGDYRVLHPEAKALLGESVFVPKPSQTRYLALYLYFLVRSPRRLGRLVSLFKSLDLGSLFLFADLSRLNDALHPSKGIALAWELRKLRVSYMHIYGSTYPTSRGLVASYLLGIPFSISTFVDFDYDYAFKMFRQKVEHARFVVACTRFCAGRIQSYTSEQAYKKVHVIYNGIDCSRAEPLVGVDRSAKARLPCIIAIGRLVEKKGFDYLVKACALLKSRGLSPKCVIVGEGVEREKLLSLVRLLQVEGEVELRGAISDEQLASYMVPENILVAPSVYAKDGERDGIPTVLFEAMFRGLPVISTAVSGIPELVIDGENGVLVAERDEHALADAIERLLTDARLRERLRRRAHQKVIQDFCLEKSAQTLWSLIKSHAERTS